MLDAENVSFQTVLTPCELAAERGSASKNVGR